MRKNSNEEKKTLTRDSVSMHSISSSITYETGRNSFAGDDRSLGSSSALSENGNIPNTRSTNGSSDNNNTNTNINININNTDNNTTNTHTTTNTNTNTNTNTPNTTTANNSTQNNINTDNNTDNNQMAVVDINSLPLQFNVL